MHIITIKYSKFQAKKIRISNPYLLSKKINCRRSGKGIKQNKGTAAKYFEKGCDLNDGQACRNRAWLYVKGKGKYHDPNMAFSYFSKGCDLHDAKSCSSVGYSYLHGSGTKKDLEMARKYYKNACTQGHKKSCSFK